MSNTPKFKKYNESYAVDSHMCRICMSLSDLLIPIFKGEGVEQELGTKIQKYLPVKILPNDTLPQQLCYHCAGTLIAWNTLYTACLETDQKFHSFLNSGKTNSFNDLRSKELDSDDEPLMPLGKKKLIEHKVTTNDSTTNPEIFNPQKKKRKLWVSKKLNKSEKNMPNENQKNEETSAKSESVVVNNNSSERDLSFDIKTECDSEDDSTNEEINGETVTSDSSFIKCEFCNKSYKNKKSLSRHLKKFHDETKSFEAQRCDLCGNIYKTRTNLERHYTKEHLSNQVSCPVCQLSFNSKKLDIHLKSVHGVKTETENEEKFKCKLCEKWFKNKYVRNSHVKEAHLSEPMKCELCDFEGVRTVLRRHKRDVHAEKRFLCSLCPGAFKTLHTLKMHMTSHSDIRCYTCDICGMGFKRLNNVRDHMKCHEQKSNQCQICGNFFARKRYLAIHEKTIHNFYADGVVPEEKGFECGTCGAKLKWKKNLLAHMRIHTGEKPYVCNICNKDFICHGSLRTHMAKHSVCVLNESRPLESDIQNQIPVEVNVFNSYNP